MGETINIMRKEFSGFFASPAAFLFLGAFLAVTLFVFFWVETFFARNLADVRPLFEWMPLLLIFLVAALTMRMWSEERRSGTLETLLTTPVRPVQLVLGKFLAGLALVALALALTLPLPITVAQLGPLDWGPVVGGYVAALFLASAYIAIGLFMSARTDNPIVALIMTVLVCGVFYLLGSSLITTLFGREVGGVLALLGTGSRFDSITRGVLDLRDLYYYVSITGVFLVANLFTLERLRWAGNPVSRRHRHWAAVAVLAGANIVAVNFWLSSVTVARADITQGNLYSLSDATQQYLDQLQEPLFIRGYFSSQTHPLLAPLIPQVRDLLQEYAVAGGDRVQVEILDPHANPEIEQEASSQYGIQPVPFQVSGRYEQSVVSSYFDIVVAYGDEYETLNFRDLIEVRQGEAQNLDVRLQNPEYEVTSAIRKVFNTYQAGGNPFSAFDEPVEFVGYMSPAEQLPDELASLRGELQPILDELAAQSNDQLSYRFENPEAGDGQLAQQLNQEFGFRPMAAGLFDTQPFWFYMTLESADNTVQIPLPDELTAEALERAIDSGVERLAPGFLRTVAISTPSPSQPQGRMGRGRGGQSHSQLRDSLSANSRVVDAELSDGHVPAHADMLLVMSPQSLGDKAVYAVDQFLMRGGTVLMSTSAYDTQIGQTIRAMPQQSGLGEWLGSNGITVEDTMVLDPQNASLPIPAQRTVGGRPVREIRMVPYPHFPDVRGAGLNAEHPITAPFDQLTLNWASPVTVDSEANSERDVTELVHSSAQSWVSDATNVVPDFERYPETGFEATTERGRRLLSVVVEGEFESFFADKESPLLSEQDEQDGQSGQGQGTQEDQAGGALPGAAGQPAPQTPPQAGPQQGQQQGGGEQQSTPIAGTIESSPGSSKLILVGSNAFANDSVLDLASQGMGTRYQVPIQFIQNTVDWAVQGTGLASIRTRAQYARTLNPGVRDQRQFWEYLNYGAALLLLVGVWGWRRWTQHNDMQRYQSILAEA